MGPQGRVLMSLGLVAKLSAGWEPKTRVPSATFQQGLWGAARRREGWGRGQLPRAGGGGIMSQPHRGGDPTPRALRGCPRGQA